MDDKFKALAAGYDAGHAKPRCQVEDAVLARALARAVPVNGNVLDAGCGTGLGWRLLKARHRAAKYIGLDVSTAMLAHAVQYLEPLDTAMFLEQDMAAPWPVSADYLDAVLCLYALNYLDPEGLRIFSDRARWHLKSGGRFVFVILTETRFRMKSYCPTTGMRAIDSAEIKECCHWATGLRLTGLSRVLWHLNGHWPGWAYRLARPLDSLAGRFTPDAAPYMIVEGRKPQ
jgi:SAM-dependent methyltransferase